MRMLRRFIIGALFALLAFAPASAQSTYKQVTTLITKYKGEKGVMAFAGDNGIKLQTVKMMLRKEFGEEFANNIKAFAIIFYKDASSECVSQIVSDASAITRNLREVDIKDRMKPNTKARGYIRLSEDKSKITDLVIVVEAPSPKLIYLGGDFKAEKI